MKTIVSKAQFGGLALALACSVQAATWQASSLIAASGTTLAQYNYFDNYSPASMVFRDSTEAQLLRDAYRILATGDHDYSGHRVNAMKAVEAAGTRLGMDLHGDAKGWQPQPLSDEKLREARHLIVQVRDSAEVKDQDRVVKHLNEAVNQIDKALDVR